MTKALESAGKAALVSAAEQRALAEDKSLVVAAVNDGRLAPTRIQFWLDALKADRAGCRQVIASLAAGPKPAVPIEDPHVEVARQGVAAALKRVGIAEPPRRVAAAPAPLPAPEVAFDSIGGALSQIPAPVRIVRGKDPATWSDREMNDATAYQMFPGLRDRLPKPPGSAGFYQPTGSEPSLPVQQPDGTVEWAANPNYRAGD